MTNDIKEFNIETIPDPEAERDIYDILDTPDEYYDDKDFTRKQEFNKRVREERARKIEEQEKHRAKVARHYPELIRIRNVSGMIDKILILILEDDERCRGIAEQLMSASTILRKIAIYLLIRHVDHCLAKENYKGTTKERITEMKYTTDLICKLRLQLEAITKMETYEEKKFDDFIENLVRDISESPPL